MNSKTTRTLCPMCGGKKKSSTTTFSADYGEGIIIIRNVNAEVCIQCGEEWIDDKTAAKLETISSEAQTKKRQLEVIAMNN